MATLTIRKFDEDAYQQLAQRAKGNNRSMEAEAREILEEKIRAFNIDAWVADLRAFRETHAIIPRPGEDAVSMVRAVRDA